MPKAKLTLMISHAGEDKAIAEAWKTLLGALYGDTSGIWFSNDPGGAFNGLQTFGNKIESVIRKAKILLTIQTPYSVHKPWVLWEAGLAKGMKKNTFIAIYGLKAGQLGNPLDAMDQDDGMDRSHPY